MFYILKRKKICSGYVSKNSSNREKQVVLLMVSNIERSKAKSKGQQQQRWHYVKTKKTIYIIKRNNYEQPRWFLLSELLSFFNNKKGTSIT